MISSTTPSPHLFAPSPCPSFSSPRAHSRGTVPVLTHPCRRAIPSGRESHAPGLAYRLREFPYCHSTSLPPPCPIRPRSLGGLTATRVSPRRRRTATKALPAHAWPRSLTPSPRQGQETPSFGSQPVSKPRPVPPWRTARTPSKPASRISFLSRRFVSLILFHVAHRCNVVLLAGVFLSKHHHQKSNSGLLSAQP